MERVLVTGGYGFIGSHTVDRLIKKGHEVIVLDNLEKQVHQKKTPEYRNPDAHYIIGDIRYSKHWLQALKGVDSIIHLAGAVGTGQSFWQPRKYLSVNTIGTATLYQILQTNLSIRNRINRIVVASSKSIYGEGAYTCQEHGLIFPESRQLSNLQKGIWDPLCPVCGKPLSPAPLPETKPVQNPNPYSLGKYTTENMAIQYSKVLGIDTVALRYFNVYGPRQSLSNPYTGVLAIFLSRLKNGNPPVLYEDGRQMRDYIYVEDVAEINEISLRNGTGSYNVGTGHGTSLISIVGMLNEELGMDIDPLISGEFRIGDNRHDFADNNRLRSDLKKTEFLDLKKGIHKLVQWSKTAESVDRFDTAESERKKYLSLRK
ncbi:MAG: SDR family NAD(P)-dependent oxidoreductase [Candidatus Thermoplasmatota archaeon]|nr:SDR family NAD(P)-dependent oxidoreductase [Candidatus Thermoplasmatota archaeon]